MRKMEDALKEYHNKRDFTRTAEPAGGDRKASEKPIFVIQKHDARTLHYDIRLEVDGVLKSWAVPKGPSTDPRERRLAIRTEDHPLEYAEFEGMIPQGEYGGGPVIVWDRGNYRNLREEKEDGSQATMEQSLEQGKVEIWLEGQKLHGGYALIRTGKSEEEGWLLLKMRDDAVNIKQEPVRTEPESVLSGRTLEEIVMEGSS
jgi:bifunctional non-homologous end joining protein LigD